MEKRTPTETQANLEAQHQTTIKEWHPRLIALAKQARHTDAESHRPIKFLVGGSVLAWNGHEYQAFAAGNKTTEGSFAHDKYGGQKPCAERRAMQQAKDAGFNHVVAVVTVCDQTLPGEQVRVPEELLQANILHSCDQCLQMFAAEIDKPSGLVTKNTLVINYNDAEEFTDVDVDRGKATHGGQEEERTVEELLELYPEATGRGKLLTLRAEGD